MYVIAIPLLLSWITQRLFVTNPEYPPRVAFQPPGYVFGIVWFVLYLLFGLYLHLLVSAEKKHNNNNNNVLLALWILNLVLNLLWSPLVFVHKRYVHGLYASMAILATLIAMVLLSETTQLQVLLVPYLTWMILATLLNVEIVHNQQGNATTHH
jgi:translocator protein